MKTKDILILSRQRTGSNYVSSLLNNNGIFGFGEIFENKFLKHHTELKKSVTLKYNFNGTINKFYSRFVRKDPVRFLDTLVGCTHPHEQISVTLMKNSLGCRKIKRLVSKFDYIVINYRENILDMYLSVKRARKSLNWVHTNYDDVEVEFDLVEFNQFMESVLDDFKFYAKILANKNISVVCYEKLHMLEIPEQLDYIVPGSWGFDLSHVVVASGMKRQSSETHNSQSGFTNQADVREWCKDIDWSEHWKFLLDR